MVSSTIRTLFSNIGYELYKYFHLYHQVSNVSKFLRKTEKKKSKWLTANDKTSFKDFSQLNTEQTKNSTFNFSIYIGNIICNKKTNYINENSEKSSIFGSSKMI